MQIPKLRVFLMMSKPVSTKILKIAEEKNKPHSYQINKLFKVLSRLTPTKQNKARCNPSKALI